MPLKFVWSFDHVDVTALHLARVVVAREPGGRWCVPFFVEAVDPAPQPETVYAVGVDLDVVDFAVTSEGERIATSRCLGCRVRNARSNFLHRASTRLVRCAEMIAVEDLTVKSMMGEQALGPG